MPDPNAVALVVLELHWRPDEIDKLYLDDWDYNGLYFWEKVLKQQIAKIK